MRERLGHHEGYPYLLHVRHAGDRDERTYCTTKKEEGKDGEYKGEFKPTKHVEYDEKEDFDGECDQDEGEHDMA